MERGTSTTPRRRSGWAFPWRSLLLIAVLVGVVRAFFCAVLRVPSGSMEPTIHGDPVRGDELLVFSPWFKLWAPGRFDLAVFERPDNDATEKMNVKRIVGLPGESIRIADGDLYITSAGGTIEKRIEKSYSEFRPLLIRRFFERFGADFERHFSFDPQEVRAEPGGVTLIGGEGENRAADIELDPQAVTLDDGWMDSSGMDHPGGELEQDVVFDVEIALSKATACVHLNFSLGASEYRFDIVPYSPGHVISLARLHDSQTEPYRRTIRYLTTGSKHHLAFFHVDGQAGVSVDGRNELCEVLPSTGSSLGAGRGVSKPTFGVWAGDAHLTKFEVWRDIHYTEPSDATYAGRSLSFRIPEDSVFVLGDHSGESIDSRFYGAVPLKNLRGRPFLIWGPSSRFGLLH